MAVTRPKTRATYTPNAQRSTESSGATRKREALRARVCTRFSEITSQILAVADIVGPVPNVRTQALVRTFSGRRVWSPSRGKHRTLLDARLGIRHLHSIGDACGIWHAISLESRCLSAKRDWIAISSPLLC